MTTLRLRSKRPWSAVALTLILFVSGCVGLGGAPQEDIEPEQDDAETVAFEGDTEQALLEGLAALGHDVVRDSDGDGLADVVENYVYGSNPQAFSTTGNGIPDGWFARHGLDPTLPGIEHRSAAPPPSDAVPDAYGGAWPDRFNWSLRDAYRYGMPDDWPDDDVWDSGIDPRQWAEGDEGVPYAWLHHHGLDLKDASVLDRSLTGDGFSVRDNWLHATDPAAADTDADALSDADEVRRYGTDALKFSTSGSGVPDGWLVRHGLDPSETRVGTQDPARKGMTVQQVWQYNKARFGLVAALDGAGLSPTTMSHRGDGVPDGWLESRGLDPLEEGVAGTTLQCAAEFEDVRHLEDVPEGSDPLADLCLSVEDYYAFDRPALWQEQDSGPWWGGLDPAVTDQDEDGLPDAVEIRGWFVERAVEVGPNPRSEWIHVAGDPRQADSDGDGLSDHEEFMGIAEREAVVYTFSPTDPGNPDTAFSGLTDAEKVFALFDDASFSLHEADGDGGLRPLLDPSKRDSAGDFLSDGETLRFWVGAADRVGRGVPYNTVYPGSSHSTYEAWIGELAWRQGASVTRPEATAMMAPDGDIDGDGTVNVVDATAGGDRVVTGWQVDPELLRFSDFERGFPRAPTDPANPDTDGDGLPDEWELRWGLWNPCIFEAPQCVAGWDLDPANWNSGGDGETSDGEANLDDDRVQWHVYIGSNPETHRAEPRTFPYTNAHELQEGTNPRVEDQNVDGVTEGWTYFWGKVYPQRVDLGQAGDFVPSDTVMQDAAARISDPEAGKIVKDEVEYVRFVVMQTGVPVSLDSKAQERIIRETEVTIDGQRIRIATVEGTYEHKQADDSSWGLNPYLLDTDGDTLPDAWEALYAPQCASGLHPAQPGSRTDTDNDGLTSRTEFDLQLEFGWSTNPCLADTNRNGIEDGAAVELGLDPLSPGDIADPSSNVDTDGDGVADWVELQRGWDPRRADTASSGLLDGENVCLKSDVPAEQALIVQWRAQGIAHRLGPANHLKPECRGAFEFLGSKPVNADPGVQDTSGDGIPDGWLVRWGRNPTTAQAPAVQERSTCGMPTWWDAASLGVWWWGLSPTGGPSACPGDRDLDGLDDANGEDPRPAASQMNLGPTPVVALPDALDDASVPRADLLRAGQSWGDCAGDPLPCFDDWQQRWDAQIAAAQAPVMIVGLEHDLAQDRMAKGSDFTVTGRVVAACGESPCTPLRGVEHRTVVVRWAESEDIDDGPLGYDHGDGRVLGVGFTDPEGRFTLSDVCLCQEDDRTVAIPESGVVALGQDSGTVTWETNAAGVPVGASGVVLAHAYATTTTFWDDPETDAAHPQYTSLTVSGQTYHSTGSAWAATAPVTATSPTTHLSIAAPTQMDWSQDARTVTATITLVDDSQAPLGGRDIDVSTSPHIASASGLHETDAKGTARVTFTLPSSLTGELVVRAAFAGAGTIIGSDDAEATILLQAPVGIEVLAPETPQRLGQTLSFDVQVFDGVTQEPIGDAEVRATLAGVPLGSRTTDADGTARFEAVLAALDPGPHALRVIVPSTPATAAQSHETMIDVVAGSTLEATVPEEARSGESMRVFGRLTLPSGAGIEGMPIHVHLGSTTLGSLMTATAGRFDGTVDIPNTVSAGTHSLRVVFDGTPGTIDASSVEGSLHVSVPTSVRVDDVRGARGQTVVVMGTLRDGAGKGLEGEFVNVSVPDTFAGRVLTGQSGAIRATVALPADVALGAHTVAVTYDGSTGGVYGPSVGRARLVVGAPVAVELEAPDRLVRGLNPVSGRLVTVPDGEAVEDATLVVSSTLGGEEPVTTGAGGRFLVRLLADANATPGMVTIHVAFAGDETYGPANNTTEAVLRVPTRIVLATPAELGRGQAATARLALLDDQGRTLSGHDVGVEFLGRSVHVTTDNATATRFTIDVAGDAELGTASVRAFYAGEAAYDAAEDVQEVLVKDGVSIVVESLPEVVEPGQPLWIRFRVEDSSGGGVAGQTVSVRLQGDGVPVLATTDEDGGAEVLVNAPDSGRVAVTLTFAGTEALAAQSLAVDGGAVAVPATAGQAVISWAAEAWFLVAAALVVAVLAGAVLWRRHSRGGAVDPISRILQQARARVEAGDPWAATVLIAYRRLVEHLSDFGLGEKPEQTVRDFVQAFLSATRVPEHHAVELVSLFERARYADHVGMRQEDSRRARFVLQNVLKELEPALRQGRGRPGPGGGARQ